MEDPGPQGAIEGMNEEWGGHINLEPLPFKPFNDDMNIVLF